VHAGVIHKDPALLHHLFQVPKAERRSCVPANARQHHFQRIVQPLGHLAQFGDHRRLGDRGHALFVRQGLLRLTFLVRRELFGAWLLPRDIAAGAMQCTRCKNLFHNGVPTWPPVSIADLQRSTRMTTSNPIPVTEQLRELAAADPGLLDTLAKATSPEAALQHLAEASARSGLPIDLDAARAAMMQALGSVELMSDEALAEVAGGTLVPGAISMSVMTFGLGCAIASIHRAVQRGGDCGRFFND